MENLNKEFDSKSNTNALALFLIEKGVAQKEAIEQVNNLCYEKHDTSFEDLSEVQKKEMLRLVSKKYNFEISFEEFHIKYELKLPQLYDPALLKHIHEEIDKYHKKDEREKLTTFLICLTSYLNDAREHCSCALKGDSSVGKDSIIQSNLRLIPEKDWFILTRATTSALEDSVDDKRIIAFSEINKHRDKGANSEITETFKQLAEGGVNVIKKDPATGYRKTINIKTEQKTLIYGTTETEKDEELETRYLIIGVKGYPAKSQIIIEDWCDKKANAVKRYKDRNLSSWVVKAIETLEKNAIIEIPYATELSKIIDGKTIFDLSKPRIIRDIKRLLSITSAIAFLYQFQRKRAIDKNLGMTIIYSEPTDLISALEITKGFFTQTYSGIDHRLKEVLDKIIELEGKHDEYIKEAGYVKKEGWVFRHLLAEEMAISSTNTIKKRIKALKSESLIETHFDPSIPKGYLVKGYQQGINRVSQGIMHTPIDTLLTGWLTSKKEEIYNNKQIFPIILPNLDDSVYISEKLTPSNLTPSNSKNIYTEFLKPLSEKGSCTQEELYNNLKKVDPNYKDNYDKLVEKALKDGDIFENIDDNGVPVYRKVIS